MITTILRFTLAAFAAGGAGLYAASRSADPATRRKRLIKWITYFAVVHVFLLAAFLGWEVLTMLLMAIGAAGAFELYRGLREESSVFRGGAALVYTIFGIGMIVFGIGSSPQRAVFVYLVVAAFDGFSQVAGQLFGKRQLAPRISPTKTLEGTLGGALMAVGLAVLLRNFAGVTLPGALIACLWLLPAALAGDLAASWLKRKAGIKDFGRLLPGHGGILDRFDSLLVAAPVSLLVLR